MTESGILRKHRYDEISQSVAKAVCSIHKPDFAVSGALVRTSGMTLEARGLYLAVGSRCQVELADGSLMEAEVVGFSDDRSYLMAIDKMGYCAPGARVFPLDRAQGLPVGEGLIGRVLDGNGRPFDEQMLNGEIHVTGLYHEPINPLQRKVVTTQMDVGVRSINSLLSIGRGQRIGLFARSGVGKSVLLAMMTRNTNADVVVVGLIGERGREVKEFLDVTLGPQGMKKAVVIAAPANFSPLQRVHAALYTTSIAEYFRNQGKNVLILMDSLTRYAQAHREIALSIGEAPATRGYPSSVFAKIPELVERAGTDSVTGGSITAIYTVLAEDSESNDPITDTARAVLDGHICLSRELAESGHYPAIDIEASISRVMRQIVGKEHLQLAQEFRAVYSKFEENKDVIQLGLYQPGSDKAIDRAITLRPALLQFLQQGTDENMSIAESVQQLKKILAD